MRSNCDTIFCLKSDLLYPLDTLLLQRSNKEMTTRLSNHTENSNKNSPMKSSSYCIIHLPVLLWPEKRGLHLFQTAQNGFGASVEFLFNDSSLIFAGSSSSSSSPYSINLTNVSEIQNVETKASSSNQIKTGGKNISENCTLQT